MPFVVVVAELATAGGRRLLGVLRDGDGAPVRIGASVRGEIDPAPSSCADAGVDAHEVDGFVSYANDLNEGLAIGAALGVREVRWSTMVWGGGGGGVAAAVNAAAAAVAC